MKKISAIMLVILCIITLSSCASVGYEKAPSWIKGKTWTGHKTYIYEDGTFTEDYSFTFYNDGTFRIEDHFEKLPDGMIVNTSGDSNTYQINFVGPFEYEGSIDNIDATLTFTKVSDNECELYSIIKSSSVANPYSESVTLHAN